MNYTIKFHQEYFYVLFAARTIQPSIELNTDYEISKQIEVKQS